MTLFAEAEAFKGEAFPSSAGLCRLSSPFPGAISGPADAGNLGLVGLADGYQVYSLAILQAHQAHNAITPTHRQEFTYQRPVSLQISLHSARRYTTVRLPFQSINGLLVALLTSLDYRLSIRPPDFECPWACGSGKELDARIIREKLAMGLWI